MRSIATVIVAASTVIFWTSFDDPLIDDVQASESPAVLINQKDAVTFARPLPRLDPPSPATWSTSTPHIAVTMQLPALASPISGDAFQGNEAELRRVTELEIARMQRFGIGMGEDGTLLASSPQTPDGEQGSAPEYDVDVHDAS